MTGTPEEIAADDVMMTIEYYTVEHRRFPEDGFHYLLGHLTELHKLRDERIHEALQHLCFAKYMDDDLSMAIGDMQNF